LLEGRDPVCDGAWNHEAVVAEHADVLPTRSAKPEIHEVAPALRLDHRAVPVSTVVLDDRYDVLLGDQPLHRSVGRASVDDNELVRRVRDLAANAVERVLNEASAVIGADDNGHDRRE